jgi:hypothetical protein
MMIDRAYTDKDKDGKYVFHVGKVLKFDYEGTPIHIRITKIDRKNKKMYGEHISLYDFNTGMSHYGHDVDASDKEHIFCRDCQVEIDQPATEEGEVKAIQRQHEADKKDEANQAKLDKKRRFRYELLKTDGTIKKFGPQKRKKISEIRKILDAVQVGVVPPVYYPQRYEEVAIYSDQEIDWNTKPVKNPHLLTIPGDPDLNEPEEYYIVGDALAEIEVK